MDNQSEIRRITMAEFFSAIVHMKTENWRLVQICAANAPQGFEMSYSFCKGYEMVTLRLDVGQDEEVASITQLYPCAFLQENEAKELFGVNITKIQPDYRDKLYRIAQATPFGKKE